MRLASIPRIVCCFLLVFGFSVRYADAQSSCGEALRQAQRDFDQGRLDFAMDSIRHCLEMDGFDKEEKVQALRLITLIYLFENDSHADSTFRILLKAYPEFRVDQSDPKELVFLYENFRTDPLLHLRVQLGGNTAFVRERQNFSTLQQEGAVKKSYSTVPGLQADAFFGLPLGHRNIRLNIGAEYQQVSYQLDGTSSLFTIRLQEEQQLVQIPLFLSLDFDKWSAFNFERRGVVPFLYAGGSYIWMVSARFTEIQRGGDSRGALEVSNQRYGNNISLLFGGGVKAKFGRNYLTLDLRFQRWMRNVVQPSERYSNQELVYHFGHIDSDFSFDMAAASLGFEMPMYAPRRRKRTK